MKPSSFLGGVRQAIAPVVLVLCACASREPLPALKAATYEQCVQQGIAAMQRHDYDLAAERFKRATDLQPGTPRAHNLLGLAYFQRKQYALAEESFSTAVAFDPSFASAYCNLGGVYAARQEYGKAKEMLLKALSLSPDLVAANYTLATALIALGEIEDGVSYLAKAAALDPHYLEAHSVLMTEISSAALGQGEIDFVYAKAFASTGNVEKTLDYLARAREAGFSDWHRIAVEKEFDTVRGDPRIQALLMH